MGYRSCQGKLGVQPPISPSLAYKVGAPSNSQAYSACREGCICGRFFRATRLRPQR